MRAVCLVMAAGVAAAGCGGTAARPAAQPSTPTAAATPTASPFDPVAFRPPPIAAAVLRDRFRYDAKAPLDVQVESSVRQGAAVVSRVGYRLPDGSSVIAVLVAPTRTAHRVPGVVFAHGGAIDPNAFLTDALAVVASGAVAVLPDIPMTITGDAPTDLAYVARAVIAERRALDLLAARPDVDPTRLGFVGHSWGGDLAAIMAGVEPRLDAVAIVSGSSRISTDMLTMGSPTDQQAYLTATTAMDGFRYVALAGRRHILIQYGTQDTTIPSAFRTELTRSAVGASQRRDYDAGHDLINFAAAATDRLAFLTAILHLG